ncbi:MAG: DUF881 domain-containing protein [Bacillota bacterium]|nr:DUF881 domain-containing protein [Bacillota bacterium]
MYKKIFLTTISIILGLIFALQYQVVKSESGEIITTKKASELAYELRQVENERENLLLELEEIENELKQYEESASMENDYIKNLNDELNKYKLMAGIIDVEGEGIVLTIDNPSAEAQFNDYTNNIIYNYEYLLLIVSNLNAAGAEAISINGQRYTNYTEIVPVGSHLNINGVSFVPPFEIRAIGNKQTLQSVINFKGGVVWEMQKLNYKIDIEPRDNLKIERYMKPIDFKYAEPINEDE